MRFGGRNLTPPVAVGRAEELCVVFDPGRGIYQVLGIQGDEKENGSFGAPLLLRR